MALEVLGSWLISPLFLEPTLANVRKKSHLKQIGVAVRKFEALHQSGFRGFHNCSSDNSITKIDAILILRLKIV